MGSPEKISIHFNGQAMEIDHGCSITHLLESVSIRSKLVAVEVNQAIVARAEHTTFQLRAGDVVEAVTLVGGG